eukprot:467204_1
MMCFHLLLFLLALCINISIANMQPYFSLNNWTEIANLPTPNHGFICGYHSHTQSIFIFGGDTSPQSIYQWNLASKTFISHPSLPFNITIQSQNYATYNNYIYFIYNHSITQYNMDTLTLNYPISTHKTISYGIKSCTCISKNGGNLFILGGAQNELGNGKHAQFQIYNILNHTLTAGPDMTTIRVNLACVSDNTYIYAIGGDNGAVQLNSIERIEINNMNNGWSILGNINTAKNKLRSVLLPFNDNIYILGGLNSNEVEVIYTNSSQYDTPYLDNPLPFTSSELGCAVAINNGIYYLGGIENGLANTDKILYTDIRTETTSYYTTLSPTKQPTTTPTQITAAPTAYPANIYRADSGCSSEYKNLGIFDDVYACAEAALIDQSCLGNKIMWSQQYSVYAPTWGCRCCAPDATYSDNPNPNWAVYMYPTIPASCAMTQFDSSDPIVPVRNYLLTKMNITNSMRIAMDIIINSFPGANNVWSAILQCGGLNNTNDLRYPGIWLNQHSDTSVGFHCCFDNKASPRCFDTKQALSIGQNYHLEIQYDQKTLQITVNDEVRVVRTTADDDFKMHSLMNNIYCYMGSCIFDGADVIVQNIIIQSDCNVVWPTTNPTPLPTAGPTIPTNYPSMSPTESPTWPIPKQLELCSSVCNAYFHLNSFTTVQNNAAAEIEITKYIEIQFDMTIKSLNPGWKNIFQIGNTDAERLAGLWINPSNNRWTFHQSICSNPNDVDSCYTGNYNGNPDIDVVTNDTMPIADKTYHFYISQTQTSLVFTINYDTWQYFGNFDKTPWIGSSKTFWLSDPWHQTADIILTNICVRTSNDGLSDLSEYELILNHKNVSNGLFSSSITTTGIENENNPEANTYSIIGKLDYDKYKIDDKYFFKLIYRYTNYPNDVLIWSQTSWLNETNITGADLSFIPAEGAIDPLASFKGLGASNFESNTLLDGNGDNDWWHNSVGTLISWSGGIPAFNNKIAYSASLYILTTKTAYLYYDGFHDASKSFGGNISVIRSNNCPSLDFNGSQCVQLPPNSVFSQLYFLSNDYHNFGIKFDVNIISPNKANHKIFMDYSCTNGFGISNNDTTMFESKLPITDITYALSHVCNNSSSISIEFRTTTYNTAFIDNLYLYNDIQKQIYFDEKFPITGIYSNMQKEVTACDNYKDFNLQWSLQTNQLSDNARFEVEIKCIHDVNYLSETDVFCIVKQYDSFNLCMDTTCSIQSYNLPKECDFASEIHIGFYLRSLIANDNVYIDYVKLQHSTSSGQEISMALCTTEPKPSYLHRDPMNILTNWKLYGNVSIVSSSKCPASATDKLLQGINFNTICVTDSYNSDCNGKYQMQYYNKEVNGLVYYSIDSSKYIVEYAAHSSSNAYQYYINDYEKLDVITAKCLNVSNLTNCNGKWQIKLPNNAWQINKNMTATRCMNTQEITNIRLKTFSSIDPPQDSKICISNSSNSTINGEYKWLYYNSTIKGSIYYNLQTNMFVYPLITSAHQYRYYIHNDDTNEISIARCNITTLQNNNPNE